MKIYHGSETPSGPHVLAVGTFDGLHRGHQHLIGQAREEAEKRGEPLGILTFEPAPEQVLRGTDPTDRRLLSRDDKMVILESLGVDSVYEIEFDEAFAEIHARDFIRQFFLDQFPVSRLNVGDDFRFGRDREGNPEMLADILESDGVDVDVVEPLNHGGEPISSTRIREHLREGRPGKAQEMLGRPYVVHQTVEPGDGRGREIGFPTLNFPVTRTIHPRFGVYSVWFEDNGLKRGVANFGRRPTVDGEGEPVLEVHCLDDQPGLEHGEESRIYVIECLRGEREFDSIEDLKKQIKRDIKKADESLELADKPTPISEKRDGENLSVG